MFSMNRLSTKYKTYSKSLQKIKEKLNSHNFKILNESQNEVPTSKRYIDYIKSTKSFKGLQLSKNFINKYSNTLVAIQNNIQEKYLSCDAKDKQFVNQFTTQQLRSRVQDLCNSKYIQKWAKTTAALSAVAVSVVENTPAAETVVPKIIESSEATIAKVLEPSPQILEPIPEPPPIPDGIVMNQINELGESTFASLGLGGWSPVGIVQNCFEYLHVTLGVPWWEAIIIGTIIIRLCLFPLVIIAQRNAAKMNNYLPQMQAIQVKMTEARQSGNQLEVARYSQELMLFMKEKQVNPFKNMIVPFAQMPVFISFFMGLRQMANTPVESLRDGGLFWFTDLTVPDQFFALPIITSLTLWATIELGTDTARLSSQNLQTMKYVLRAMPILILPFTVNFPGAILCYWVSSNFISLAQVGFLRIPAVRDYFKIDPLLTHNPQNLPMKNKGFVGGLKDSWTNIKITKELEERQRLDAIQFQRAGRGPIVKTYKYDPTKQTSDKTAISAKKR